MAAKTGAFWFRSGGARLTTVLALGLSTAAAQAADVDNFGDSATRLDTLTVTATSVSNIQGASVGDISHDEIASIHSPHWSL